MKDIPLGQKFALTIKESAVYFNIGEKKLRRLAEKCGDEEYGYAYAVISGNRYLIIREAFEKFMMDKKEL